MQAAEVSFVVFGFLTVFTLGHRTAKALKPLGNWSVHRWALRKARRRIERELAYLTPKEREIFGYLLANNQPMFDCTHDGGEASTLISKGFVVCALLPGQSVTPYGVPFRIPDHVWAVLVKQRSEFPNTWKDGEPYPWSISWMAQ
jgi:hypothetical protein